MIPTICSLAVAHKGVGSAAAMQETKEKKPSVVILIIEGKTLNYESIKHNNGGTFSYSIYMLIISSITHVPVFYREYVGPTMKGSKVKMCLNSISACILHCYNTLLGTLPTIVM